MSFLSKLFARFRKQKSNPQPQPQPTTPPEWTAPPTVTPVVPVPPVASLPEFVEIRPTGVRGVGKVRKYPRPNPGPGPGQDMNAWSYATRIAYMINPETGKSYVDPNVLGSYALGFTPQRWTPDTRNFAAWVDYRLFESDWWDAEESARQANMAAGQKRAEDERANLQPGEIDIDTVEADDFLFYAANYEVLNKASPTGRFLGPWTSTTRSSVSAAINWLQCQGGGPTAKLAAAFPGVDSQFMAHFKYQNEGAKNYNGRFKAVYDQYK